MVDKSQERDRLLVLRELAILDTLPEREFDALAKLAKRMFGTQISLLSLIDKDRQWFKARCGLDLSETAREPSFCSVAVEMDAPLVVEDTRLDPRFVNNPFVLGEPNIRFYAGVPVRARKQDGSGVVPIASLCVIDDRARSFSADDLEALEELACIAEALVEARATARTSTELAETRRAAVEKLERERRRLKQAERMADMGSWRLAMADNRVEWSDGVSAIHELPAGYIPPVDEALEFYPERERKRVSDALTNTLASGEPFDLECDFVTAKGNLRRVRTMGELELSHGTPVALIGLFQDITERHRMEEALLRVSRTDELTRLPNRAEFNRVLDERLAQPKARNEGLAVLLIDLDGFKQVNDTLGHAAGDDILRSVGDRLRATALSECFAARLGGDEFAVIVPSPEHRDAFRTLLDDLLASLRLTAGGAAFALPVSATIGVAWSDGARLQREELLRRADMALYAAKRTFKGTAQIFSQTTLSEGDLRSTRRALRA